MSIIPSTWLLMIVYSESIFSLLRGWQNKKRNYLGYTEIFNDSRTTLEDFYNDIVWSGHIAILLYLWLFLVLSPGFDIVWLGRSVKLSITHALVKVIQINFRTMPSALLPLAKKSSHVTWVLLAHNLIINLRYNNSNVKDSNIPLFCVFNKGAL